MLQIPWLQADDLDFPPPATALADPNGLLALGGDLQPQRLLNAYASGIFPWYEEGQPILWWSPDPRMVLKPESVHISRSLLKTFKAGGHTLSMDRNFSQVISLCAETRQQTTGTWIMPEMQQAYTLLHELGHAHSVEVWRQGELVGGLYGIALGRMFFGESMFSLEDNASKIAFCSLCLQLQEWDFRLIDCQLPTEHLRSLGATEMARTDFLAILAANTREPTAAQSWSFQADSPYALLMKQK